MAICILTPGRPFRGSTPRSGASPRSCPPPHGPKSRNTGWPWCP
ncbi:hypothetical protein EVA_10113 [gut metagenome]|uniref:Uncharacterized protein n=1 Tax=gut metagenome TaxID=749906 RepID=J9GIJ6_9ZZZZ